MIAGTSILSTWARSEPHQGACRNQVFVHPDCTDDSCIRPFCSTELAVQGEALAERWLSTLGPKFHSAIFGPFVLVGNLSSDELDKWYTETIRTSVDAMCGEFFDCQFSDAVTLLMFADEPTYRQFADSHSGRERSSIYGYYKPSTRTVVINLSAGGGTVIHELTHALMDFDFPDAPLWLNEGIASMHEECRVQRGDYGFTLKPLDNWRLPILQKAIQAGSLRSTRELMNSSFSGDDEAVCYAQARYLCLFLNQLGLLDDIYRGLRDDGSDSDSGEATIERTLRFAGYAGYSDFESAFQQWVLERDEVPNG